MDRRNLKTMYKALVNWENLLKNFRIYKVILKEVEPSDETKEFRKKIYEPMWDNIAPEIKKRYGWKNKEEFLNEIINKKHLIFYYTRDGRLRCTCLGYKSAKKVGRVCHHLYEFYKEVGADNETLEKIMPRKLKFALKKKKQQ